MYVTWLSRLCYNSAVKHNIVHLVVIKVEKKPSHLRKPYY